MKKLLLMCMGGFSTGILMEKMKNAAKEKQEDVDVKAVGASQLDTYVNDCDVLLLAPQISYMEDSIRKNYPKLPIYAIDSRDYGMLKGDKVLDGALQLLTNDGKESKK